MGLNLLFPVNLIQFNSMFIGIAMADFLPSEDIISSVFDITETDAHSERLELLDMES